MVRRLSLAFAFFGVLSAVAAPAFADAGQCMFRCGATTDLTLSQCSYICGVYTQAN